MRSLKIEDYVKAKHFRVFVFNEEGLIMMIKKSGRWNIPFGQVERKNEGIEKAVHRVVLTETKTALNPIVLVTATSEKNQDGDEVPKAILVARTSGGAQIRPDEKTWHRFVMEATFRLQPGYSSKPMADLLEKARRTLICEEIRTEHDEETQRGKEKYNMASLL